MFHFHKRRVQRGRQIAFLVTKPHFRILKFGALVFARSHFELEIVEQDQFVVDDLELLEQEQAEAFDVLGDVLEPVLFDFLG